MILSVQDVEFSYKSRNVLRDVSFELHRNELLAILGPNGVGKTTLLKCINAILRPGGGSILVEETDLLTLSQMEIARNLAYVAQQAEGGRLTAFDAILLGRRPHIQWKIGREDLVKTDAIIRTLGLEELSLRFLDEMSGGELQKVGIARALVQEPRVLLLDEPTSSLDLKNQQEILGTIRHIVSGHGMAGIMTMHDLNSALRFADKVLFMRRGEIFAATERKGVTPEMVEAVYGLPVEIEYIRGHPVVLPLERAG
ncbi:MAG: ABC transporter ATP-binding protein [Synergistales bacterium]|nr:ABC transporter ATP-binding protein [Synergistales bacterium]